MRKEKYIRELLDSTGKLYAFRIDAKVTSKTTGKRVSLTKVINLSDYKTPKQALQIAVAVRDQMLSDFKEKDKHQFSEYPTVRELFEKRLELFPVTLSTQKKESVYFRYGIGELAEKTINNITLPMIQKSINDYSKVQRKEHVSHLLTVWRKIFKVALYLDYDIIDKTALVTIPKNLTPVKEKKKVCSIDTFNQMLELLSNYAFYDKKYNYKANSIRYMLIIMRYTGMRNSEVMALEKNDIDLDNELIHVYKAVGSTFDNELSIKTTKTANSIRYIPIHPKLKNYLVEAIDRARFKYLITDYNGKLLSSRDTSTLIRSIAKKHNLTFNAYMLRHMFSSELFSSNQNPRVIQDLLGHATSDMSLYYARTTEEERKEALSTISSSCDKFATNK